MKTFLLVVAVFVVFAVSLLAALRWREETRVRGIWNALQAVQAPEKAFAPEMLDGLPEVAQRYLCHAIAPGTPLARRVEITMTGSITKPATTRGITRNRMGSSARHSMASRMLASGGRQ